MAGLVDVEEADPPALDVVEGARGGDRPRLGGRWWRRGLRGFRRCGNSGARHLNILWYVALRWYRLSVTDKESRSASLRHLSYRDVSHEDDWVSPSRTRFSPARRGIPTSTPVAGWPCP